MRRGKTRTLALMPEPSFLGISKTEWDLINSFANWFAAAGTFAAAWVALYLARRAARPTARVSVGHRIIVGAGYKKPYPEFAMFRIVNTGDRPIRVSQLGWRTGIFRKRFAIQMFDATQSSPLPVDLTHGQEASWLVPFASREEPWPEYFAKGLLSPNHRSAVWSLRAQFFTSVGHVFEAKPEESLLKPLRQACAKLSNA
jgi:hypothetical protein